MSDNVDVQIIAWFSPNFVERRVKGKWVRAALCRVCRKEITSIVIPDAIDEAARQTSREHAELFLAHLQTAHRDLFDQGDFRGGYN